MVQNKVLAWVGGALIVIVCLLALVSLPPKMGVALPTQNSGDALWHLPKFAENGWFIHASNGRVRLCNVKDASIKGERKGPTCTHWE